MGLVAVRIQHYKKPILMIFNIEAPGHPNQERLQEFYKTHLTDTYSKYNFVHSISAYIQTCEQGEYMVGLRIAARKGASFYSKDRSDNEGQALRGAMKKLRSQIERYRQSRYGSFKRSSRIDN
ncbi:MAG: hypothetical protein ACI959_000263 [Limisphaerales bacterium]|jgi:hypothetical protein